MVSRSISEGYTAVIYGEYSRIFFFFKKIPFTNVENKIR
jgi:hypothetical protein